MVFGDFPGPFLFIRAASILQKMPVKMVSLANYLSFMFQYMLFSEILRIFKM